LAAWPTFTSTPPAATPLPTVGATAEAGPSPTPFKHVVRKNETLLGIAAMYGVSLDALLAVNPGVDPFVLSIGQELLIPGPEGTPVGSLVPTATPIPLALQPPTCYRKPSGGWWCLGAVRNPTAQDLENLVVEIRLEAAGGGEAQTQQVFPPLNRLPAGETMPVAASFPDNGQDTASASALVQGVIPARDSETRYTVPAVELATNARQAGGRAWQVGGVVTADAKAPEPNRTLVLVTAFDDAGRVVGYAVWEADPTMGPGEKRQFDAQVFSLGPEIARVSLLAESYALTSGEG
jgi:LysM repeat protein